MTLMPIRLIIVEDVDADAELALQALRKGRYDPDAVRVEDEASFLAMLKRPVDIILCDYNLPQFSAPRALEIARKNAPGVPVIIVTGTMGDEAAAATIKAGATDYLLKDNLMRLPQVVARALEEVELRNQVEQIEARYQQLVESVPAVAYTAEPGPQGRWFYLSPQIETLIGVGVDAITGDAGLWERCIHPADRARVEAAETDALATGSSLEIEYRLVGSDGTTIWVRDEAALVHGSSPYFHGVISDITEAKRAEEALAAAEQTYRSLVQTVKAVVWRSDMRTGSTVFVSDEAETLFGYPPAEWTADPDFWERHIHPDDRASAAARGPRALEDRSSYVSEYRFIAADGRIVWVRDLVEAVVEDGAVVGFVGLMVDITELKSAELEAATRADQQVAVVELGQLALRGFSLPVLWEEAVQLLTSTLKTECALFVRCGMDGLRPLAASGYGESVVDEAILPPASPEGQAALAERPLVSLDVRDDPRFSFEPLPGEETVISGMCAPVRDEDGVFGVLSAYSARERAFSTDDVNFLQAIANVVSSAIRRERSQKEIAFQARLLFEVGASVCVTDAEGTITHWNDAAAAAVGFESDETIGRNAAEVLLQSADLGQARSVLKELHPGDRFSAEWPVKTKDGRIVPFHLSVSAQADYSGDLSRIIIVGVDISERKEMEKRLRRSEDQFRTAFMNMPTGMMLCDRKGRYIAVNDAFCRLIGYDRDELIGMSYEEITHPDDLPDNKRWYSSLIETGGKVDMTKRYVRKDGAVVWAEVTDIVLQEDDSHEFYALVHVVDITERKRVEDESRQLEKQLVQSQKMEAVGRLAGGIAHDFNNLLSVIINYSAFLDEDMEAEDPRKEDLREIKLAGERATSLVRRLLTFSRREVSDVSSLDLREVVEEMKGLLERSIGEDVTLDITLPEEECAVRADTSQLEQILMNLVVNARDAMPHGGTISISTCIETITEAEAALLDLAAGRYVALHVADDGEGMSPETLDHVFEPFFTTKPREQGTGLGLSTVYGLVKQSGGAIRVASVPGEGTVFDIFLPFEGSGTGAELGSPLAGSDDDRPGERTVLVVEDDDTLRGVVVRALRQRGYGVLDAGSGPEAIALLENFDKTIDILLTDVVMPEMAGPKLADRLRQQQDDMRFVFMSGYSAGDVLEEMWAGDENFLQKPFSSEDLYAKLEEVMVG